MKRYRQSTIAIASQEEDDIAWLPPLHLTTDGGHADNDFVSPSVSTGNIARVNGKQSIARRIQIDRSRILLPSEPVGEQSRLFFFRINCSD